MPGSLPSELTSFVGRERLLADIERLLAADASVCRLLTLTGPGGSGKTRVAIQAAAMLAERFRDGASFVGLAPITHPQLVVPTIAKAVGARSAGGLAALDVLKNFLLDRQLLLILDNFEQVLGAALEVSELLAHCPGLHVIITSRAPLRVYGERELAVLPLDLPGAVRLFCDRAQAVKASFILDEATRPVVEEICTRLDGLPLAIELAAARVRLLDPAAMLARLDHRLQFLTGGARDLPTRQQTLRNTIGWSYELLAPHEQELFRRASIFVGGCSLDALAALGRDETEALEEVDSLVGKSLLRTHVSGPSEVRISMLETTREFGSEQLAWIGELDALRRRHAEYFLGLAERAEPELWGPRASTWHARLEADHDNIRAALEWGLTNGGDSGSALALQLAGALPRFWWTRAHFAEGLSWLGRTLARSPARSPARMKALHGAGWLAHFLRDATSARRFLEESLSIARELDDRRTIAWVLHVLGRVAYFDGDAATARALAEQALALAEAVGDDCLIGWAVHLMGLAAHITGDYATAEQHYARSMALREALGHREAIGVLYQLKGIAAHRQGDLTAAREYYRAYLAIAREVGSIFHLSNVLAQFGALAADQGQPQRAARLLGAASVFHESSGTRPIPLTEALGRDAVERTRRALGEVRFATAWAAGRAMSSEEAIVEAQALDLTQRPFSEASTSPLTQREDEVAALVARGLTNRQIASELVVTERTIETHVAHILDKLGFASRTQIGVWAAREPRSVSRTPSGS